MRLIKEYEWCKEYNIDCLTIDIYEDYITIWNSYKITKISHMLEVIETIRQYSRIYNRSNFQLVSEWRSHNLLYDLNYETAKTKDVNPAQVLAAEYIPVAASSIMNLSIILSV